MLNVASRVVVGGVLWLLALPSLAQQGAPPLPKPGPEHEVLKQDVGTWDATVEMMEPGKPPAVSKGVETVSLIEGGLWTVTDFKSTMMGAPFHGHGTNGFDPTRKRYVFTWIDSMSTGLALGEATYDPGTKTMKGWMEGPDLTGKTMKMNETTEWKDPDTRVFTMSVPGRAAKTSPRCGPRTSGGSRSAAARDRGDDRDRVAGLEGGLGVLQEPDVLLVHEQPHVAPQLARGIAEPVLEALVLRVQGLDEAGDAAGLDLHLAGAPGQRPERRGDLHTDGHVVSFNDPTMVASRSFDFERLFLERLRRVAEDPGGGEGLLALLDPD